MSYSFNVRMALHSDKMENTLLAKAFPAASEAVLVSNSFPDYMHCFKSCSELLQKQADSMTSVSDIGPFTIKWETNPILARSVSGDEEFDQRIKDENWEESELIKLFIINPNYRDVATNKMCANVSASIKMLKDKVETRN